MHKACCAGYLIFQLQPVAMDDATLLAAAACLVLAALVYLMWKAATAQEWQQLTHTEKKKWRNEEEARKEGSQ